MPNTRIEPERPEDYARGSCWTCEGDGGTADNVCPNCEGTGDEPEPDEDEQPEMEPGDVVTVFEDPITRREPEGEATLVERIRTTDDGLEYWTVRFDHPTDPGPYPRWVGIHNENA